MKMEKIPSRSKSKPVSAAKKPLQAKGTPLAPAEANAAEFASRPAALSREERRFAVDAPTRERFENRGFSDGASSGEWFEAEIEFEIDGMRKRGSQSFD